MLKKSWIDWNQNFPTPDASRGGVLVTGGTGMLGKAVACELRRKNWYTRVVARKIPSVANRIPGVDYVAADLADNISPDIFKDISIRGPLCSGNGWREGCPREKFSKCHKEYSRLRWRRLE